MTEHPSPPLHPAVAPLACLVGTWRGTGEGSYPTIDDFSYTEEITFGHVGKPFLSYWQKTSHATTESPLHAESGYWRPTTGPLAGSPNEAGVVVEVVLAHPTGLLESLSGRLLPSENGGTFDLRCPAVLMTASAVEVIATERRVTVDGDTLTYDISMAAVGQPMTHHLSATLNRA